MASCFIECFPFAPLDTPRYARHSGRTGNISNHSFGLNQCFPEHVLSLHRSSCYVTGMRGLSAPPRLLENLKQFRKLVKSLNNGQPIK